VRRQRGRCQYSKGCTAHGHKVEGLGIERVYCDLHDPRPMFQTLRRVRTMLRLIVDSDSLNSARKIAVSGLLELEEHFENE
jgi:hypothetical protein